MSKLSHDIILKPIITEESMMGTAFKKYTFKVAKDANKAEIAKAVEEVFGVKVENVNTVRTMGKIKRQGRFSGRTPEIKKAYVTLKSDSKSIEFFDGMAAQ